MTKLIQALHNWFKKRLGRAWTAEEILRREG